MRLIEFRHANRGKLIGHADFQLPNMGLIIRNCSCLDGENGIWVKLPEYRHDSDRDDRAKWRPCVEFVDGKRRQQWEQMAAQLVKAHLRGSHD